MTVKEIAELAGVSIGTVDRVLYKRGRVSEATKARIEDIIEKYQFTPNPIARRLKRNRSWQFIALMPRRDQDAGYWGQALAGIPVIFFDADIPDAAPLCAIGQDSFRGGYLAGRLMHLFAGKIKAPVAVLDAHGEDYHIIRRRDGFLRYAGEYHIPTLVQEYSGYKGTEISVREISLFLRKNPDLTGIFITNCMAHRVAEAVRELKKPQNLLIIGYDLIPNNRILLQEGRINAIISQRPEDQGRDALLTMYRSIVLEQKIPARVEIPLDIYFKENVPKDEVTLQF
ncbi:hypothetical protein AGMMS50293_31150 [Spirochaetia bacterium]|nr:hypothetical protein AGMMS50293_31150 [Spirochaetia bacterium]